LDAGVIQRREKFSSILKLRLLKRSNCTACSIIALNVPQRAICVTGWQLQRIFSMPGFLNKRPLRSSEYFLSKQCGAINNVVFEASHHSAIQTNNAG
jgi:hypothetical protein